MSDVYIQPLTYSTTLRVVLGEHIFTDNWKHVVLTQISLQGGCKDGYTLHFLFHPFQ